MSAALSDRLGTKATTLHHHPEARFQTPDELVAHYRDVHERLYPRRREWPVVPARAAPPAVLHDAPVHRLPQPLKPTRTTAQRKLTLASYQPPPDASSRRIIADIAGQHGLTADEVLGEGKSKRLIAARFDAIAAVARARPGWSTLRLGALFNRDHTSIINALRKRGVTRYMPPDDVGRATQKVRA